MSQPVFDQKQAHVQLRIDALAALMESPVVKTPTANPARSGAMPDTAGDAKPPAPPPLAFLPGLDPGDETPVIETGAPEMVVTPLDSGVTVARSTWPFRVTCDEPVVDVRVEAASLEEAALACLPRILRGVAEYALDDGTTLTVTYQDAADPFRFPRWAEFEVQEESGQLTVSEPEFDSAEFAEHLVGRALRLDERRYLAGPIIVDHLGCAWELPDWLRYDAIPRARIAQVVCEAHADVDEYDRLASLEEAVAVLYTAALAYPLGSDAAEAYIWASAQVLPRYHRAESPEKVLAEIYGPSEAERYLELRDYARTEVLDRIRRDTRRYVVKHQREREKK